MKILVLGVSGMLGSAALRLLGADHSLTTLGTARSGDIRRLFAPGLADRILTGVDVENADSLVGALREVRPEVVINCVGIVKQLGAAKDPLVAIPINSLLPHRLARLCELIGARLVHMSTDCVFSGRKGNYKESDPPDAEDLYGRSKLLGEVDYPNAVTLRTSIIGRELSSRNGLIEWFLNETGTVRGFSKAIFSGLTTDELTRAIAKHVLPAAHLRGVYHVSSEPINKLDLLTLVREEYGRTTTIIPDESVVIDRSLDSTRFRSATGYAPPSWRDMIARMRQFESTKART